jgi:hypothetical protein
LDQRQPDCIEVEIESGSQAERGCGVLRCFGSELFLKCGFGAIKLAFSD